MTKHYVPSFDYHFQKGLKKIKNLLMDHTEPRNHMESRAKNKGRSVPKRRGRRNQSALWKGTETLGLVRVTWCHPHQAQAGYGAANSEGGARTGIKIATTLVRRGIKKPSETGDGGGREAWGRASARLSFCGISGCGLFYRAE